MSLSPRPLPMPLSTNADGIVHVTGTRVGLDIVVGAFNSGASPEEIALDYDTLELADVYAVIAYYLANRRQVEMYLSRLTEHAETVRIDVETRYGLNHLRQRLRQRRRNSSL